MDGGRRAIMTHVTISILGADAGAAVLDLHRKQGMSSAILYG